MNSIIRKMNLNDAPSLIGYFMQVVTLDPERVERPEDVLKITTEDELKFINSRLEKEMENEMIARILEIDGNIVSEAEIEKKSRWIEKHIAEIRFAQIPGNDSEVGKMLQKMIVNAKEIGIEKLIYFHIETQKNGLQIMKDLGFKEFGKVEKYYKRDSEYISRIYLSRDI